MKKYTFGFLFCLLIFSCNDDLQPGNDEDQDIGEDQIEFEITDFIWKKIIHKPGLPRTYDSFYPIIHEENVIFSNWELEGFVAMDLETGEIAWDNRGQTNNEYLGVKPIKIKNKIYTIKSSGLRVINLDNGEIEVGYLWPPSNEFLDNQFNIHNNTLYTDVHEFAIPSTFSGWVSCPLDALGEQDWTYFDRQFMINNEGFQRNLAAPVFYEKPNGETLMIHYSLYTDIGFDNIRNTIEAYNLDRGEQEWVNENSTGGSLLIPHTEKNKIIFSEDRALHCVDALSGITLWRTPSGALDQLNPIGSIIRFEDVLIVLTQSDRTVAINIEDGSVRWEQVFEGWEAQLHHNGGLRHTANLYNDRLYYINSSGNIISMDPNDGSYRVFKFPQFQLDEELELDLFEQDFKQGQMVISDDGVIYTADGIRFLAFEVPDK